MLLGKVSAKKKKKCFMVSVDYNNPNWYNTTQATPSLPMPSFWNAGLNDVRAGFGGDSPDRSGGFESRRTPNRSVLLEIKETSA